MPFITPIVAAISAAGSIGAAIAGGAGILATTINTVLAFGLSVGASALSAALSGKGPASTPGEVAGTLQLGGNIPRQVAFGRVALKGQLAFVASGGMSDAALCQVYILSDGWCDGLDAVWIGDKRETLVPMEADDGATAKYFIEKYGDTGFGDKRAYVWFYDGRPGQSSSWKPAAYAPDRVSAGDRYAGMAHVVIELRNNDDTFDSFPDFTWELRGYRCHDPRKDIAFGGAGAHSIDNPASWEFTENPALHVWNYLRGISCEGQVFMGMELADYDLLTEQFVAAANICDEAIPLDAGGAEQRYRASAVLTAQDGEHRASLAPLIQAMAGYLVERNGSFGLVAGAAQLPVATITDEDFDWTRGVKWSGSKSRTNRVNEVHGQFVDPAAGWQANSYPQITSAVASAEDGERLAVSLDFGTVTSITQAQRVARIRMRETRRQATGSGTLGMHMLWLEPGDWIRWTSATFGADKIYRIVSRDLNPDDTSTVALQEIGNEVYSWNAGDEQPYLPPATGPNEPPLPSTVTNFNVQADVITAEAGDATRPILRLTWDPIEDSRVVAVVIEYRPIGSIAATRVRDDSPHDGLFILDQPPTGLDYEFRATISTVPARPVSWTPWVQIGALDGPRQLVDLEDLFGQARINVEEIARIGEGTIRGEIQRLNEKMEELAGAAATEAGNAFEKREFYKVVLEGGLTQNFAAIEEERIARIDAVDGVITATAAVTTALGTRLTNAETYLVADAIAIQSLTTTVTSHGSTLSSQSSAITSLQSTITNPTTGLAATATATSQLKTRVDDSSTGLIALSESITVLESSTQDNSAILTRYGYSKNGTEVRYGIVGTINGVSGGLVMTGVRKLDGSVSFGIEITGNLIVAGAIKGAHLETHSIITNSAQIGSLIVDHISVKDGAITNSAAATTAGSIVNVVIAVRATGKVHISAMFNGSPGQYSSFLLPGVLQVSRGGVGVIKAVGTGFEASGSGGSAGIALLPTSLIALDAPGAGVHTYTVETTNGIGVGGVTIVVQELSK